MRSMRALTGIAAVLIVLAARVHAEETKLEIKDVPEVVMKAALAKFPGAKVEEAAKEVDEGETTYEISLIYKGIAVDVAVGANGEIEEIETETAIADLPKAVTDAILAKHAGAKLMKAEEIIEFDDGQESRYYEVVIVHDSRRLEVSLTPAGELVEPEQVDN